MWLLALSGVAIWVLISIKAVAIDSTFLWFFRQMDRRKT